MIDSLELPRKGPALFPGDGGTVTYERLQLESDRMAKGLASAGIGPGSIALVAAPNGLAFAASLLACWNVGAVFAPASPSLASGEVERVLTVAQPRVILADPRSRLLRSPALASCTPLDEHDPAGLRWLRPPEEQLARPAPHDGGALLLFTSGSTGAPKGVLLNRRNVLAGVRTVVGTFGLGPEDSSVALLPWTHGHGLIGQLLASLMVGASVVVPATSNVVQSGVFAGKRPPTWLTMVPPQVGVLCEAACTLDAAPPRLRFLRTASAPLNTSLARRAESIFDCPVAEAYGMTETSHQAAANPPDAGRRRIGTVGLPTGLEIRLDPSGSKELEVRGDAVFKGYLGRPDLTGKVLDAEGWYRTGDIGEILRDGCVRLLGRSSELINRGGFKISPVEVEEAIASHPGVLDCIVTAVDDPALGQDVAVLVVQNEGANVTIGALKAHCREQLSSYKQPSKLRLVASLPTLSNGKPNRRLAADLIR